MQVHENTAQHSIRHPSYLHLSPRGSNARGLEPKGRFRTLSSPQVNSVAYFHPDVWVKHPSFYTLLSMPLRVTFSITAFTTHCRPSGITHGWCGICHSRRARWLPWWQPCNRGRAGDKLSTAPNPCKCSLLLLWVIKIGVYLQITIILKNIKS